MRWCLALDEIRDTDRRQVGAKAFSLAVLQRRGFQVPRSLAVPASAYEVFVEATGLRERILLELNRKEFKEMRWEELWDAGLRIRNLFLTRPLPVDMEASLREAVALQYGVHPVAVRSSSTQEDSSKTSFAGLHESFLNVRGAEAVIEHVKLVWASLWSDAALLYRQELGLEAESSAMAVLIQELVLGERSGIVFSRSPNDPSQMALEAVHGLNQGLVDGRIEPDRWVVDRETRRIVTRRAPSRERCAGISESGVTLAELPPHRAMTSPLEDSEVMRVVDLALAIEHVFGRPQDIEWTWGSEGITVLQARPITSLPVAGLEDRRAWYLSLRRSFENLQTLRGRIEGELIPAMIREHESMAALDLTSLSDGELAREIERRKTAEDAWVKIYWDEFIPFAHGMRLFGQVYNDTLRPADPYEFLNLLGNSNLESLRRNRLLEDLASMVRRNPELSELLKAGRYLEAPHEFVERVEDFIARFGDLSCPVTGVVQCTQGPDGLIRIVLELAAREEPPAPAPQADIDTLERRFLERFQGEEAKRDASELLDLARASYRLRDDDNIHLARIESGKVAALMEAKRRLDESGKLDVDPSTLERIQALLVEIPGAGPGEMQPKREDRAARGISPRQLVGQPAGPGLARGPARVIEDPASLHEFRRGDVLVCDAVDPNMTYVVPLANAIVERRGGMLILGAIIAREYGLPCVTGVPEATRWIHTGDRLTVDGFLGIVSVGSDSIAEGAEP